MRQEVLFTAGSGRTRAFDDAMATDAASPEEVLQAPPEVDASSDDRVDAGVTANPGESVAEVTLPRAEVEAPEEGHFASGAPTTVAPEPESRRRPPNPSAPPPRRRAPSAPVVQARDDRGVPVRWVLGGVLLGLALSGLGPDATTPNSSRLGADPDSTSSHQLPGPGGFLPFGFRASAANRASDGGTVEELVPFGGVPRTAADARAALDARRSRVVPPANNDKKNRAGSGSGEARGSSFGDGLARWITVFCWGFGLVRGLSLFLPVTRSVTRWRTPLFLLGALGVVVVVFAIKTLIANVNNVLHAAPGGLRLGAAWGEDHALFDTAGHVGGPHDVVAKIEVSKGADGVIRVGSPTHASGDRSGADRVAAGGGGAHLGGAHLGGGTAPDRAVTHADSRRIARWGCEELTLWLKSEAGDWAGAYRERMCSLGMNADLLLSAEDADLRADLGVTSRMHRRRLLAAAAKLRETTAERGGGDAAAKVWIGRLDDSDDAHREPSPFYSSSFSSSDESNLSAKASYVLPGAIASLSRWRAVAPAHRTAQLLGVANCPRLRVLRDVLVGDGCLANLAGLVTVGNGRPARLDPALLALWFVSPGVVISLRSHELWGLGSPAGAFGVGLGFALVAMWCHGLLEVATRWLGGDGLGGPARGTTTMTPRGGVRRRRAGRRSIAGEGLDEDEDEDDEDEDEDEDGRFGGVLGGGGFQILGGFAPGFKSAAFLVLTRCVYPGLARALMLEAASLVMHAAPSFVVDVLAIVGGVCLPLSRVGYRCWYVSSRGRGSQFWSDLRHVVRARVGMEDGPARGGTTSGRQSDNSARRTTFGRRSDNRREPWASGDDWAEIAYGYAREEDDDEDDGDGTIVDRDGPVDDGAAYDRPTVEAMERIIFGPAGDAATSLDVLEGLGRARVARDTRTRDSLARGDTRTRDGGSNANTRDAGTGAGSVTTTTTGSGTVTVTTVTGATSTGDVGMFDGGETILTARGDPDRVNRSSRSSSSSSSVSRSHWPGPVQLPEWIDEERAPSHFKCPITLCVMREPAVTPAGITYERSALMQWLDHQHVEPSTKRRLKRSHVVPNLTLRAMIEDWLQHERDVRAGKQNAGGAGEGPGSSSATRVGLPPGAAAVSHADRDALRAVRQRMYAALKERAALGVCYEEQRWEAYTAARGQRGDTAQGANDGDEDTAVSRGSEPLDADEGRSGEASASEGGDEDGEGESGEARGEVAGSNPEGGESGEALSSPPTPAVSREEEPPGSLDATLDDDAMND